jgi:hypothetical protein
MSDASKSPTVDVFFFSNEGKRGEMGCEEKYETTRSHVPTRQQQQQQQTTPSHNFLQHNKNFHLELEQKTIGHFFFFKKEEKHN